MREGFLEVVMLELGKEGGFLGGRNKIVKYSIRKVQVGWIVEFSWIRKQLIFKERNWGRLLKCLFGNFYIQFGFDYIKFFELEKGCG